MPSKKEPPERVIIICNRNPKNVMDSINYHLMEFPSYKMTHYSTTYAGPIMTQVGPALVPGPPGVLHTAILEDMDRE